MATRHCIRCGETEGAKDPRLGKDGEVTFRSRNAMRCVGCDAEAHEDKAEYSRVYQRARYNARERLVEAHQKEYDRLMGEELAKAKAEAGIQ